MKLSFAKSFDQGKVTRAQYQCVEQLNASDMRKTVYEVLAQALNDDELQDAQEFFGSSVGIKYARYGILKIYSQRGATPPEPEPLFTSTDRSELASFASRPAGKKLIVDHVLESDSARQAFTAGTVQLLRGCMAMR
ncbi:hypothetical protein PSUB009319_44190 [Ralstonia sp. SET104]|nr:hypothetical protein PSUB009319_44190 [Ralstonia sp. SET104]